MFNWDKSVKIEKFDIHSRTTKVIETTPIDVVSNPNGHRSDDIINSLCIAVAEMMQILIAQAASASKIQKTLEESIKERDNGRSEPEPRAKRTTRKRKKLPCRPVQ